MAIWNTIADWFSGKTSPVQYKLNAQPKTGITSSPQSMGRTVPFTTDWANTPAPNYIQPTQSTGLVKNITTPWVTTQRVNPWAGKLYPENYLTDTTDTTTDVYSNAISPADQANIDLQLKQLAYEQGLSEEELALRRQELEADTAYKNAQLAWEREQWGQQLAQEQKNYLSNLAAEPRSWLEYAAASGQAPVIQPWMLPLMGQDYGLSAGATIPGWSPTNMTGIPELTNPSAQYFNRIGPTAQQQFYGYEQAKQGATPEESAWRLWSYAPPSGNRGLVQTR